MQGPEGGEPLQKRRKEWKTSEGYVLALRKNTQTEYQKMPTEEDELKVGRYIEELAECITKGKRGTRGKN